MKRKAKERVQKQKLGSCAVLVSLPTSLFVSHKTPIVRHGL